MKSTRWILTGLVLLTATAALAQQPAVVQKPMWLNVLVNAKGGVPATGLQPVNFSIQDNHVPVTPISIREVVNAPVSVVLVLDGVNMDFETLQQTRTKMVKYLRTDEGKLKQPTTVIYLSSTDALGDGKFSTNGMELADKLEKVQLTMRTEGRSAGGNGDGDRVKLSLLRLHNILDQLRDIHGYKALVWFSPGWPLMESPAINLALAYTTQKELFKNVVDLLTEMRLANITLYSVNVAGVVQGPLDSLRYENYLGGVPQADKAVIASVSLQVLAAQSGGEVLNTGNDVGAMMAQCYADTRDFYRIGLKPVVDAVNFHKLQIQVDQKGLTVHAPIGYYTQP